MNQKITLNSTSSNNSSNDEESIAVKRISKLRIFSEQLYKNMHPDVAAANISPSWHAVNFGAIEGRTLFKREQIARVLGILSNLDEKALDHPELVLNSSEHAQAFTDFSKKYPKADIFVSSLGNIFMQELALDLAVVLKRAGVDVQVRDENYEVQLRSQLSIFVAPMNFLL